MAFDGRTDHYCGMKIKVHVPRCFFKGQTKAYTIEKRRNSFREIIEKYRSMTQTFLYNSFLVISLVKVCPECGGSLRLDAITKNFICKGCGLYAPREKFEELREKLNKGDGKNEKKEEYLDWWQSSKKDKKNQGGF